MELPKMTAKKTRSEAPHISVSRSGFPKWYVVDQAEKHPANSYPDSRPARKGIVLEDEIGRQLKNPPWSLVESVIRELDPGHFNSFACLSVDGTTYVQCLCGLNGYHLEWRITETSGDYTITAPVTLAGPKKLPNSRSSIE